MDFKFLKWRKRKAQSFDRTKIKLTKAGKTFNVYDKIQENREDTELYPTLEKYGCIDRLMLDTQRIYDDFTKYKDLRGVLEQKKEAESMFYNLPLEVRNAFNNNISDFTKNGEQWLKNKINEEKEQQNKKTNINNMVVDKSTKNNNNTNITTNEE